MHVYRKYGIHITFKIKKVLIVNVTWTYVIVETRPAAGQDIYGGVTEFEWAVSCPRVGRKKDTLFRVMTGSSNLGTIYLGT